MAVAGAVVGEDALLGRCLDVLQPGRNVAVLVPDALGFGQRGRAFEDVERRPRVATGEVDEMVERGLVEGDAARWAERAGQAAFGVGERPAHDGRDVVVGQRLEPPDPHPRQERRVDLEIRVLGRRADERHGAVLDVGQERVLLRLVEAVNLVEEQDGSRPVEGQPVLRLGDRRPHLGDAGEDGAHRAEVGADLCRKETGEARLAGSRRPPEQE